MSKVRSILLFTFIFANVFFIRAYAAGDEATSTSVDNSLKNDNIEIKGVRLGMTKAEFKSLRLDDFSVGGVRGKNGNGVKTQFRAGQLDLFMFFTESSDFGDLLTAVKTKYPALKCNNSSIQNKLGASFEQTECKLNYANGELVLIKYISSLDTSVLSLISKELTAELDNNSKSNAGDI